jgi:hypothetical protein
VREHAAELSSPFPEKAANIIRIIALRGGAVCDSNHSLWKSFHWSILLSRTVLSAQKKGQGNLPFFNEEIVTASQT